MSAPTHNIQGTLLRALGGLLLSLAATLAPEQEAQAASSPPAPPAPETASGQEPPPAPATKVNLSQEDYGALFRAADESLTMMGRRCAMNTGAVDLEAEAVYIRTAHVLAWVVRDYPYGDDPVSLAERSTHTGWAVQAYERAFQCNAAWDNREYLEDALNLIEFRLSLAVNREKRPIDAEDLKPLRQTDRRLRKRREGLVAPTCPAGATRCTDDERAPEEDAPPGKDKDARTLAVLDAFSLEVELGSGELWRTESGFPIQTESKAIFAAAISPAARFVLGQQRQHRVQLGFLYGVQLQSGSPDANALTAQLEYGIVDTSGWLAVHASMGAGFHGNAGESKRVFVPGLGICTLGEALCLRVRGFFGPLDSDFLTVAIGLDPIRLAARQIRKRGDKS